jgi:hypothetical protein
VLGGVVDTQQLLIQQHQPIATKSATLVNVEDAKLIVKFYTPKGSQLQDPRSVVNFHDYQLFRTTNLPTIDAPVNDKRDYGLVANTADCRGR